MTATWFPYTIIERLWYQLEEMRKSCHMVDDCDRLKKMLQEALMKHLQQVRRSSSQEPGVPFISQNSNDPFLFWIGTNRFRGCYSCSICEQNAVIALKFLKECISGLYVFISVDLLLMWMYFFTLIPVSIKNRFAGTRIVTDLKSAIHYTRNANDPFGPY